MLEEWKTLFDKVRDKDYSKSLNEFLDIEYKEHTIYPPRDMMYHAFECVSPSKLKVVVIGQDPYHNPGEAMGMSFSVPNGIKPPPSLVNIYKEIKNDLGIDMNFEHGDLTPWATQGVLLLNAYLTVRENSPLSHKRPEYSSFIDDVFNYIETLDQPIVFMLWGTFAKKYAVKVKNPKHIVLQSAHPSPLSANRGGWFGVGLFNKCNEYLKENGVAPIDWKIK